jgi:putative tricarboxylic transport membrane protein
VLAGGAATALWPSLSRTHRPTWKPTQNINYVIGVAAGGSVDLYARGIKQALESLKLANGQTIIADNKPGAAGLLALATTATQPGQRALPGHLPHRQRGGPGHRHPEGRHPRICSGGHAGGRNHAGRCAHGLPLKTAKDLINALKRNPESLKIAVAPLRGLNTHLAIAKPLKLAGVDVAKLTVAPFRSSADSMAALLGGHVDMVSATGPTVVPMAQAGKVRILVSAAPERGTGPLAKVPTWREEGVAADYVSYNGVLLARWRGRRANPILGSGAQAGGGLPRVDCAG